MNDTDHQIRGVPCIVEKASTGTVAIYSAMTDTSADPHLPMVLVTGYGSENDAIAGLERQFVRLGILK